METKALLIGSEWRVTDNVQEVRSLARRSERFYNECTPGYYNSEGAAGNKNGFFAESYGAGSLIFFDMLDKWRKDGRLDGLQVS